MILFALLLGGALTTLGPAGERTLEVFRTLNDAVMQLVHLVMWIAPLGVMALLADALARGGVQALRLLAAYSLVVVAGLLIHGAVVLPTVLMLLGRRHPWHFAAAVRPALAVALGTSSSAATLPVSLEVVQERAGVDGRVASFVLPLGATINMDGTALYEAVAAVFIAQVYGIHLGPLEQVIVFLTATLAAIGAAAIPSAGTVTMAMVLTAVGLPLDGIGLILAVDRLLDMLRTTVNVWGDLVGSAVIEKLAPLPAAPSDSHTPGPPADLARSEDS
ncbi:MAG: dicarboxylate/amino acid:cation symporter [Pseudomonadota bacterium]